MREPNSVLSEVAPDPAVVEGLEPETPDAFLEAISRIPADPADLDVLGERLAPPHVHVKLDVRLAPLDTSDERQVAKLRKTLRLDDESFEQLREIEPRVLELVSNPDRLVAFALDPLAALREAGIEVPGELASRIARARTKARPDVFDALSWLASLEIGASRDSSDSAPGEA